MELSKRLETCLHYTDGFVKLADIGTDHALLPIEAVLRGNVLTALAIDNKFGPFIQGRTNVKKYQVDERVKMLLGEGLTKIDDDVDVVVISGMGGELITQILDESSHKNVKRFILQPNKNIPVVRDYMSNHGYKILDEVVFEDQQKTYEVIVYEKGAQVLSPKETLFGPINLATKPYYFVKNLTSQLEHLESLLPNINDEQKHLEVVEKVQLIKEVLYDN